MPRIILAALLALSSVSCVSSETLRSIQSDLVAVSNSQAALDAGVEDRLAKASDEVGKVASNVEALEEAGKTAVSTTEGGLGALLLAVGVNYFRDRKYTVAPKQAA